MYLKHTFPRSLRAGGSTSHEVLCVDKVLKQVTLTQQLGVMLFDLGFNSLVAGTLIKGEVSFLFWSGEMLTIGHLGVELLLGEAFSEMAYR